MAKQKEDSVYLYRNGIADFRRIYQVAPGGQKVSIPVKQDQVGDVLASIDYFGDVKLTKPPSYSPQDKKSSLKIDSSNPMLSALRSFSGAKITLSQRGNNADISGVLVGCEVVNEVAHNGTTLPVTMLSFYTEEGLRQLNLKDDVRALKFDTDADKAEFDKALARNYELIKPGSTFIDLTLTPKSDKTEEAIIQYALPVAAWNMSYRLKRNETGSWSLDGHAIVHNSTDFDWQKFWISVVTGEPNTFSHDLAEAKIPARSRQNVTAEASHGAVKIEEGVTMMHLRGAKGLQGAPGGGGRAGMAMAASARGAGLEAASYSGHAMSLSADYQSDDYESVNDLQAEMDMAEASTVGDFLILKSPYPADIPANQSALVPMFSKELTEAERVFYYKPTNDPNFPFSAVKFKNTTGMPLTKGVVTVTIEGHNAGESILEAAKPGDIRLLAHTLETGIKITREPAQNDTKISLVRINEGNIYSENRSLSEQTYTIKNKLEEEATLLIEHPWNVPQADVTVTRNGEGVSGLEKLSKGVRFTVKCKAGDTCTLVVKENKLNSNEYTLDGYQFSSVAQQGYFQHDEKFKQVSSLQEQLSKLSTERIELNKKVQILTQSMKDYNALLPNAGGNKARWEAALATSDDELIDINNKKLPDKDKAILEATQKFQQALKDLRVSWTPKGVQEVA